MLKKTTGIVLHHVKYGDSSLIIHIYTKEFGRASFLANNVRNKKAKLKYNLFHPLNILEFVAYIKSTTTLFRIKEAKQLIPLQSITTDIIKSSIAIFIAELIYKTIKEESDNKGLFDFLIHSVQSLDKIGIGKESFHLLFLLKFTKYLGIYPELHKIILHDRTILSKNEFVEELSLFNELSKESFQILEKLEKIEYRLLDKLKISRKNRTLLLEKLLEYISNHYEGIGDIKSYNILKEIYK